MTDLNEAAARLLQSAPPDSAHEGTYASMDEMAEDACLVAQAYLDRLAADESERKLSRDVRAEWMRHAGYQDQAETPQEVGTLSAEASELLAVLRIERLQDEADRIEREKPIDLLPWQPIETAPHDGSRVLVRAPKGCLFARWDGNLHCWVGETEPRANAATHWLDIRDTDSA